MTEPRVAFNPFGDNPAMVFVHRDGVRRHFEATTPEAIEDLLAKVAISEFGIPQDQALAFGRRAVKDRAASDVYLKNVASAPAERDAALAEAKRLKDENATLAQRLDTATGEIKNLRVDLAKSEGKLKSMRADMEKATAPVPEKAGVAARVTSGGV